MILTSRLYFRRKRDIAICFSISDYYQITNPTSGTVNRRYERSIVLFPNLTKPNIVTNPAVVAALSSSHHVHDFHSEMTRDVVVFVVVLIPQKDEWLLSVSVRHIKALLG
eukprot:Tbor_TRINITY_DN5476_c1_g1::TRINITY_DN5476_c1_g1_i1::g.24406::m.24406